MIGYIIEMVIGKIVSLFMSQRWYMAILFTVALLSLVALTIGSLGYLLMHWLFQPQPFGKPLTIALSIGAIVFIVALWIAFGVLQRRVFK